MSELHNMRAHYDKGYLLESDMLPDPFAQFAQWFDDAKQLIAEDANAMIISTVGADNAVRQGGAPEGNGCPWVCVLYQLRQPKGAGYCL